jgi:hypothetical protein
MNFGEHQLVQRIKERYCPPEFATLANVGTPSGTFADAVAINLWRSRGYEVVGFEVKSTRSDWLRELKDPKKAEGCAAFCHTFWIVANEGVVRTEELPLGWGLFEPAGNALRSKQKALPLEHRRELTVPFMVNIIRRAIEKGEMTSELNAAREAGRQAGIEEGLRRNTANEVHEKLDAFTTLHAEFKERTGIEIRDWMGGKELAEVYRMSQRLEQLRASLGFARTQLRGTANVLDEILKSLKVATDG